MDPLECIVFVRKCPPSSVVSGKRFLGIGKVQTKNISHPPKQREDPGVRALGPIEPLTPFLVGA